MKLLRTVTLTIITGLVLYGFLRPEAAASHILRVKRQLVRVVKG